MRRAEAVDDILSVFGFWASKIPEEFFISFDA
jgi:hypothetical protein